jgi:predicted ATPase/DNA-binding CsgD family transcriptional regulator
VDPRVPIESAVSEREAEVLALVGEHLTNAEIAARLFISVRTVESHVSSLLRKLGAADRRALAALTPTVTAGSDSGAGSGSGSGWGNGPPPGPPAVTAPAPPPTTPPALPAPLTSFVGRSAERAALTEALVGHRLVSAIGPGGVGKTRLALAVAADVTHRYAHGAWYIDLVPVTDPAMIGAAVADVLGFPEQFGRSPTETVLGRLADAEALLVLDNCEHLTEGVGGLVERLLTTCPRVTVLVTSQARLGLPFEWTFTVPGLSLAGDDSDGAAVSAGDTADRGDAMALFLDRAAMVGWSPRSDDDLRRIVAICDALDGSALAIELAAARLATRGLDGLEAALGNRLQLLTGGPRLDERHRSLRSALDWSYDLLSPNDRAVLRQVSVFSAPFTAEAAAAVVVDPAPRDEDDVAESLADLADQSLLVLASAGTTRYRMLETIRQYGAELLAGAGEDEAIHDRHLRWCQATGAALAAEAAASASLVPSEAFETGFAASADELRAALHWAMSVPGDARRAQAHELAARLGELTYARGMASEAERRYEQAAALAADDTTAARLRHIAADVALSRLAGDDALRLFRVAADTRLRVGDQPGAALELTRAAELLDRSPGLLSQAPSTARTVELLEEARTLAGDDPHVEAAILTVKSGSGSCGPGPNDPAQAERALELARRMGDLRLESAALDQLTVSQLSRGEARAAATTAIRRTELLAPLMPRRDLAFEYSDALHMASLTSIGAGDLATALDYAKQRYDLPFHREETHLGVNWLLVGHALAGDLDEAVAFGQRFLTSWEQAGRPPLGAFSVSADAAAMVAGLRGDDEGRRDWQAVTVDMRRNKPEDYPTTYNDVFDAILALHRGAPAGAVAALADDPETLTQWHTGAWRQWYAALRAEAAVLAAAAGGVSAHGADDLTKRLQRTRDIVTGNPIASAIVDRAEAMASGELDRLPAIAATLAPLSRYQQARTLVLAGGDARDEGQALVAAMGAAPMV